MRQSHYTRREEGARFLFNILISQDVALMRAFVYRPRMATSMPGMSLAFFMDIPDFFIDEGQRHPGMNRYQCTCLCELPCAQPKGSEKVRSKLGI